MKKGALLNSDVSAVIARLGHTDHITVADAGLPIPPATPRIDLALTQGVPDFMSVFKVITQEMQVEAALMAEDIQTHNSELHDAIVAHLKALDLQQGNVIQIQYVTHASFKLQTQNSRAVIRTGECTPFANVMLFSGVTF